MIPVNECFETIQCEGSHTGTPSVFLRLQGCDVGCGWCDTKHTWHIDETFKVSINEIKLKTDEPSKKYSLLDVNDVISLVKSFSAKHVVITGGEPCMYDLKELTGGLISEGYSVQIETSGTEEIKCSEDCFVTVSPKLEMPGEKLVLIHSLKRANEIKFPVGKQKDIDMLKQAIVPFVDSIPIWLQPLSLSKKATNLCINECIKQNWKLSIQSHKFINIR